MNIAKAIGIIAVVAGHVNVDVFGNFLTPYSFHIPLFFFIAGYFFKDEIVNLTLINPIKAFFLLLYKYLIKCRYLRAYYFYTFLYGGFGTYIIYKACNILFNEMPTVRALLIPQLDGKTPFELSTANWFLFQLAITMIFFSTFLMIINRISKNKLLGFAFYTIPFIIAARYFCELKNIDRIWLMILTRTYITTLFVYLGFLFRKFENKIPLNADLFIAALILESIFVAYVKSNCTFDLYKMKILYFPISLINSVLCIYIVLFISKIITPDLQNTFFEKIGKNTLFIMTNHIPVLFLLQMFFMHLDNLELKISNEDFICNFYMQHIYGLLYIVLTIVICVFLKEITDKLLGKIRRRNQ